MKNIIWLGIFIIILSALRFNPDLWPLGFIIPVIWWVSVIIFSHVVTRNFYNKHVSSSMLIGRLIYGIDRNGKPTKRFKY